jgi:hypothetical protein
MIISCHWPGYVASPSLLSSPSSSQPPTNKSMV